MAHRSQSSSVGENPLDPNYLPPHYREEYRLAIDELIENDEEGYHQFLQSANVVGFLSQLEIEHIKRHVQPPQSQQQAPSRTGSQLELTYHPTEDDTSSDTYWPMHSDLDAPGLDLGWPLPQHSFVGPTEVTTLVNPSDPEMPSIKEQARRLIKNAQQVIAVVMDIFTDIDLFADLLDAAARHVPVYILLDEQNAYHFLNMVTNCKVNLEMIHMMRVRTVSGVTYFCRTGKSFKGQVMDRFLMTDCRAVLSGNYSFMWSFEKIHRCIAHLFLGELVATFDEEFRILFAQSQPLVLENALVPSEGGGYFGSSQFGSLKRSQSMRQTRGYFRQAELSSYAFGDRVDSSLQFRREDPFRHTMEHGGGGMKIGKYSSQQSFRMQQQGYMEQGGRSFMASQQVERNAFKRHSYAEGTQESYSSSRTYMKHRVMSNLEEMEQQYQREQHMHHAEGFGGAYEQLRSRALKHTDQHSDGGYMPELEPPSDYNVLTSDDLSHGQSHPHAGRYDPTGHKRPTAGQSYACQSSPTQTHPPDLKQRFDGAKGDHGGQDHDAKQGLRDWRISSYLSAYEDADDECAQEPLGPDAFDEPDSERRFETREHPNRPKLDMRPKYGKPILPDRKGIRDSSKDLNIADESKMKPADSLSSLGTEDEAEGRDYGLTKHESFRSRINPMLQRSSRLRSSLIFSSSKLETHNASTAEDGDGIKTSSVVAEILEKRRSLSREPFDWSKHKRNQATDSAEPKTSDSNAVTSGETTKKALAELKEETKEDTNKTKVETSKTTEEKESANEKKDVKTLNMNDPESRLLYFKELAAKRKVAREELESSTERTHGTGLKKSDLSTSTTTADKPPEVKVSEAEHVKPGPTSKPLVTSVKPKPPDLVLEKHNTTTDTQKEESLEVKKDAKTLKPFPSPKFFKKDPLKSFKNTTSTTTLSHRLSAGEEILTDATDAEKSEMKKSRSQSSSVAPSESRDHGSLTRQGSNTSLNTLHADGKDTKALDFLKKQTQRLKGFIGSKGEKKGTQASDSKTMKTVPETKEGTTDAKSDHSASSTENHKAPNKPVQSRYQTSTANVLFSSNLRDDTKVILEQISANSQKNRLEMAKQHESTESDGGVDGAGQTTDRLQVKSRFGGRAPSNPQDRDNLLKRIESFRKEKKVYSRFEV
ncbi:protein FAM83H isoform X2 [Engraulis encrasicolus]|uniref:protein FAM83H isoform X2 n=1 Tax=Engraulis encrasicolus TaxID=184585 RepID=UPI002FD3AEB6